MALLLVYSLFISQNYGEKKPDRIKKGSKLAFTASVVFCVFVSVFIYFFADNLMTCFVDAERKEIIAQGARYLRIEGVMYAGIGILFLWYGYFRGIGKSHVSLILTIISLGTRVALSYGFSRVSPLGVAVIWYSIPVGWFLADVAGLIFYRKKYPAGAD